MTTAGSLVDNYGTLGGYKQISDGMTEAAPLVESYEKELSVALRWGRTVSMLHAFSRFVSLCNLTWASVVLLGTFASYLPPLDFKLVACLFLLEAVRLASASFLAGLPTRVLTHLSQDPKHIMHSDDGRGPAARYARLGAQILQLTLLIAPSFLISLLSLNRYQPEIDVCNLHNLLRLFYGLVAFTSLIALANLLCSTLAYVSLYSPPEQSLLRYYDKVVQNAMNFGVAQAHDFEFFSFAYTMLASEHSRNVQPEAVAKSYKKLIQYLYMHRLGVDVLQIYLDAEDAFVQLAAANMVGYWADMAWGAGLKEVKLPDELLTKLADKVGTGQVGWAAASSFGVLARKAGGARLVARTQTSSGCRLVDHLADLVDARSARSLSLVRTLRSFYEQVGINKNGDQKPIFEKGESKLVAKLKTLARGAKVQRLRVQAAYLLLLMGQQCQPSIILDIDPTRDAYWFQSEVAMLRLLRNLIPSHDDDGWPLQLPQFLAVRKDAPITPPR